jgi:hypothetical protein
VGSELVEKRAQRIRDHAAGIAVELCDTPP